jgi:hypothetical protein
MPNRPIAPITLLILSIPLAAPAAAATLGPSLFTYDGGTPALADGAPVIAQWNPAPGRANPHLFDQGAHIGFFGHAAGCAPSAANGPAGPLTPQQIASLTPPFRPAHGATVFSPLADPADCPGPPRPPGPAFIAAGSGGGALQLFTMVQPATPNGAGAFWGAYPATGQDSSGANASIEGSFINWVFDWRAGAAIHPWADNDRAREVSIATTQSVAVARAEPSTVSVNQVKQQVAVSFFNQACHAAAANPHLCQLRIMFDIDLVREPGLDWASQPWAGYARLMFDPAQGGLPVIEGPLNAAGLPTTTPGDQAVALWRSQGQPTQHGPFPPTRFEARISFRQLMAALRLVAQRATGAQGPIDPATMRRLFAERWNSPADWAIIGVNIGQEVHGAGDRSVSYIGGAVASLAVGAGAN